MRQNTQLDLRIVRVHEQAAGRSDKKFPKGTAKSRADGDILQIRLNRRQASRLRECLAEGGVDTAVGPVDHLQQPIGIGAFELGKLTVIEDQIDDGMLVPQSLKYIRVGRVAVPVLLIMRQTELIEQHAAELLGRVDVESLPRKVEDTRLHLAHTLLKLRAEGTQAVRIHGEPVALHICQHIGKRLFDFFIQRKLLVLQKQRPDLFVQRRQRCRVGRRTRAEVFLCSLCEGAAAAGRRQKITDQRDVTAVGLQLDAVPAQQSDSIFDAPKDQPAGGVLKEGLQPRVQRAAQQPAVRTDGHLTVCRKDAQRLLRRQRKQRVSAGRFSLCGDSRLRFYSRWSLRP